MHIDRRKVPAGPLCLAALGRWVEAIGPDCKPGKFADEKNTFWHPLTQSLLGRAHRASMIV
jgi:hypothetical protein